MMNNKRLMSLVAAVAVLVGIIGMLVCLIPSRTGPCQAVADYVAAINSCNWNRMQKQTAAAALGDLMLGLDGSDFAEPPAEKSVYEMLKNSYFNTAVYALPEGVKEVTRVKLVGCVEGETQNYLGLTGQSVELVLEITYVDSDGQTQTLYSAEDTAVVEYKNKYYIIY